MRDNVLTDDACDSLPDHADKTTPPFSLVRRMVTKTGFVISNYDRVQKAISMRAELSNK